MGEMIGITSINERNNECLARRKIAANEEGRWCSFADLGFLFRSLRGVSISHESGKEQQRRKLGYMLEQSSKTARGIIDQVLGPKFAGSGPFAYAFIFPRFCERAGRAKWKSSLFPNFENKGGKERRKVKL